MPDKAGQSLYRCYKVRALNLSVRSIKVVLLAIFSNIV